MKKEDLNNHNSIEDNKKEVEMAGKKKSKKKVRVKSPKRKRPKKGRIVKRGIMSELFK